MGGGRVLAPAAGVIGATTGEAVLLVQAALLCAGLATLLQTVGIGPVGRRLPLTMGSGFAFIAVAVPLTGDFGLDAVLGGVLVTAAVTLGAVVLVALSLCSRRSPRCSPRSSAAGCWCSSAWSSRSASQLLSKDGLDTRALLIVALSVCLGRGIAAAPDAVDGMTGEWGALFDSGIVVAAVVAVVLDLVLPGRRGRTEEPPAPAEVVVADVAAEHRSPAG